MYVNWNSIIALNKLKLSNESKKLPKLHMNQSMSSSAYTKSFEVKPQFDHHFDSKSYRILLNTTILLLRYFGLYIPYDRLSKSFSFFNHYLHIWYHDILTNLMFFRLHLLFLLFKYHSTTRSWSCFLNEIFENSYQFLGKASHQTQ